MRLDILKSKFILILLIVLVILPLTVFAQGTPPVPPEPTTLRGQVEANLLAIAGVLGFQRVNHPAIIIVGIIKLLLSVVGIIFLIFTIYGGITWMTAQGNEEKLGKARKTLQNAIIGVLIVAAAYGITSFVFSAIERSISTGPGTTFIEFLQKFV